MTAPTVRGLVLLLVSIINVSAQSALQPLPVETASTAKSFAPVELDLSPDGASVAYTLIAPRRRKLQGLPSDEWKAFTCTGTPYLLANTDLLVSDTTTGQVLNISSGKAANWGPSWSPDGKSLAFYSDRSGKAHVWIWDRSTGKLRALTTAVVHARSRLEEIVWTSDSRQVLTKILGNAQTLDDDCFDGSTKLKPFDPAARSIYTSESSPLQLPPSTESFLGDLAMLDTQTGNVKRIVRQEKIVAYLLSPSDDRVVYVSPTLVKPNNPLLFTYNLSIVSLSNGQIERVNDFSPGAPSLPASWSPDGRTITYISDGECFIWSRGEQPRKVSATTRVRFIQTPLWDKAGQAIYVLADNKIWRIPTAEAKATAITATWDRQIRSIVSRHDGQQIWSPDGASIYVSSSNSVTKQEGFYRIDSHTGEFSKALEADISITPTLCGVSPNDEFLVYAGENAREELNLWITNRDFHGVRQLTHVNQDLERYPTGEARLIDYSTADGKKLQATLLLPVNYQPNMRYPLVVWVYGGSMLSANVNRYGGTGNEHQNLQLLSSRGYAVLLPDTPLTVGTPMQDLAKTVLPAVDKAIEIGIADPDRLGVMGLSYGGYSTLALVVQTSRFKAAVMDVGFGNLSSMYGAMLKNGSAAGVGWAEDGQGRMGGPPWQFPERYVQNSPAFFLNKIETPLLISQGGMDVSPFQADEIFVGLRRLGKKVAYVRYENEGHGIEYPSNRIDYWNRVLDWFASHLRPATQQQSRMPE
jgi:dipeptidyl aminopeptidase/acylaminoacyl peptidase